MAYFTYLRIIFSLLLALSTEYVFGQKTSKWTPEQIINTEYLQNASFSPNNQMLVWTKRKGVKEKDKFVNDIYLTRLNLKKDGKYHTTQLTNGEENNYSPLFSKDGELIYFLSSRDEGKKLWSMSIFGGEPEEIHEFENGITNLSWLNDTTLLFTANEGKTLYEKELEESKDNTVVVEDEAHWKTTRVYSFTIKEKKIARLTDNQKPVFTYAISKNGKWLVIGETQSRHYPSDANPDPKFYLYNLVDGSKTEILEGLQTPRSFTFTADNTGFYFEASLSSDPEWNGSGIEELYFFNLNNKAYSKIPLSWEWGLGRGFELTSNDVIASLANGATNQLAFFQKTDNAWVKHRIDLPENNEHCRILSLSTDGSKVLYTYSTASKLPTYFVADLDKSVKSLKKDGLKIVNANEAVSLNDKLKKIPVALSEVFVWKGWKDEEVNGILHYPENYEAGKKYPLILSIHGGPSGVDTDSWSHRWSTYPQLYNQKGAFVLKPNYHGSSNHGLAFVESIKKNYYDPELEDILKGIDALDEKGMIDKTKMGVMGWSNGAILAIMLTVRYPDMFKVAAPGAGDVNWTSDFGTCRFGVSFDQSYFGGAPWDDTNGKVYNENYITKSPLFELEKVKTPTIIFHGSEDRAVPRDQGWEYYRALQQVDQAPVRFLWFPGQPHGLQKITHQLRKMKEEIAWFDKYLFEEKDEKNEAFKKESPLADLLAQADLKKFEGKFGVMKNNLLIPQTQAVKKDSIALGIFEVTNAQFKAFNANHSFFPPNANKPVMGVTLEKAKAYVAWLSEKTGEKYRLPNPQETIALHKKAKEIAPKENTLNFLAGYELTLDDVKQLKKKIEGVDDNFVKEVGSFKATKIGEASIYDLGGNVAELSANGSTIGYGATDFVDPYEEQSSTNKNIAGFRVVKE